MKKKIAKLYRAKRRQVKKNTRFLFRHPLILPTTTFILLFFVGLIGFIAIGGTTQGPSDAHIVNVFVDGEQRTVTTRARTVGELVERLQISLIPEDIVEPSKDALLLENNTQVNVYRARPVRVSDSGKVQTLLTAQRAPRLVAHDAGIDLLPEDEAKFEQVADNVLETSVSEQLVIVRSFEVQLNVYGVVKKVRTTAKTVSELLKEQGIDPAENESVQPDYNEKVVAQQLISVNRQGVKTVAVSESIPFKKTRENDGNLQAGKTELRQVGVIGEQAVIYEIQEENGVEVSRRQIQIVVLREPVNEVTVLGTKISTPTFNSSTTVAGDKAALMAAAGISASDYAYVDYIISKESNWRPGAANASGAYGLCQALPGSKMASAGSDYLTNPITQLQWCTGYATGRYGSWGGAYNAWLAQGWW